MLRFKFQLLELIFYTCFLEDFTEVPNVCWKLENFENNSNLKIVLYRHKHVYLFLYKFLNTLR